MSCDLLDVACHIQASAYEWWASVTILNKLLIVGGLLAAVLGISRGFLSLVKSVGGWPAVAGLVVTALGLVLSMLPKKPQPRAAAPKPAEFPFGTEKARQERQTKKRPTLIDLLKGGRR